MPNSNSNIIGASRARRQFEKNRTEVKLDYKTQVFPTFSSNSNWHGHFIVEITQNSKLKFTLALVRIRIAMESLSWMHTSQCGWGLEDSWNPTPKCIALSAGEGERTVEIQHLNTYLSVRVNTGRNVLSNMSLDEMSSFFRFSHTYFTGKDQKTRRFRLVTC